MDDIILGPISREETRKYLGYSGIEHEDENIKEYLDKAEKIIFEVAKPRYIYKAFELEHSDDGIVFLGTNICMKGNSIKEHLAGMNRAVLFAGTISGDIDKEIRNAQNKDLLLSVVLDAMSSVAVEQLGNKFDEMLAQKLNGMYVTFRFGVGYGDLSLSYQNQVITVLDATKRIGITVTEDNIMLPRKSITGVIGISINPIEKKKRGCIQCNLKETCRFRKVGNRCYE